MMDSCDDANPSTNDEGIIFLYSFFEKNSFKMEDWQYRLSQPGYGYDTGLLPPDLNKTGSPAKVPDVLGEDNSTSGDHTILIQLTKVT